MGASSLPDPVERYRQVRWSAGLGVVASGLGAWLLPVEPLASLVLGLPCLVLWGVAQGQVRVWHRQRRELGTWTTLLWKAEDERPGEGIYLGHAFAFDQAHAERLAALQTESWKDILPSEAEQRALPGDPRAWGVGARDASAYHLTTSALQRMALALGGTGCGKSTLVRNVARSGIHDPSRPPVLVIDPKGDALLRNQVAEEAAAAGRPFIWISLYHDQQSATYNPILRFHRAEDLVQRFDAVIPHQGSSSPAFRDNPIAWATTVCHAVYTLSSLLRSMGGAAQSAPPVLRALAWLRANPTATVEEAITAQAQEMPPECTPAGWPIDIFMVPDWALARPQVLMAWILRLARPAAFDHIPEDPNAAPPDEGTAPALLAAWSAAKPTGTAAAVWDHYRGAFGDDHPELVDRLQRILRDLLQIACESAKNRNTVGSALSVVGQTLGRVRQIIGTQEPDIDMARFCESDAVLYVECSSMALGPVARMFGRLLLGDLAAYLGERNARGQVGKPVWLIVDELAEVINAPLLQLVAMGRSAGIHALFLTQDRSGLVREIGREGADKLIANMNGGLFQFFTNDRQDAERIVMRAGQVRVDKPTRSVGVSGTDMMAGEYQVSSNTSFGVDQQTYLAPDAVMRLPVGCCAFYQGGRLHLLKVAKPPDSQFNYLASRGIA